ncbi:hypothetical protein K438DRAFT_1869615 [Mycena galopus ATCC 62051]|nr:hypothetical protein K438DRAFT_1869615 [Mycena galopus ATCC 62051]
MMVERSARRTAPSPVDINAIVFVSQKAVYVQPLFAHLFSTAMEYTVDSSAFDSLWNTLISTFSRTAISLLLHGVYVVLFLLSLYTLSRPRRTGGTAFLIVASCVMAVVASTQIAIDLAVAAQVTRLLRQTVHAKILTRNNPIMPPAVQALLIGQNVAGLIN